MTEEAQQLAANNYQWLNERVSHRKPDGIYGVNTFHLLCAKLENLFPRVDNFGKLITRQCGIGASSNVSIACCILCAGDHDDTNYLNFEQA